MHAGEVPTKKPKPMALKARQAPSRGNLAPTFLKLPQISGTNFY